MMKQQGAVISEKTFEKTVSAPGFATMAVSYAHLLVGLPWGFTGDPSSELEFKRARRQEWCSKDRYIILPWSALWVSIIIRHWATLSNTTIFRSAVHFIVIVSPGLLHRLLGKERYQRHRNLFVCAALASYVLHPGGGLYRNAVMINRIEHTGLNATNLFIRMLIGSRALFWLVLLFGYELPPELGIPLNALSLAIMSRVRPAHPFCSTMQTAASRPLFHTIALSIPMVAAVALDRPELDPQADVCNPLVRWLQFTLGLLLPSLVSLAGDYAARLEFVKDRPLRLAPQDRAVWQERRCSAFSPWPLAALVFAGASSAYWYLLLWNDMAVVK